MGTPAIAAWIAHVAFWALLIAGVALGAALFSSFVAVLDVALVLLVFKGDIRIT